MLLHLNMKHMGHSEFVAAFTEPLQDAAHSYASLSFENEGVRRGFLAYVNQACPKLVTESLPSDKFGNLVATERQSCRRVLLRQSGGPYTLPLVPATEAF